ncbi:MAG TPA: nicotinate phosphoribosyltransferase [Thermoanaerobaculia bacterium]|nr:nicotinate phosphoribosyltransferase [Thermoanaerobaculia bacterium]
MSGHEGRAAQAAGGDVAASAEAPTHALLTDLYELTMAAAYDAAGMEGEATFELFVRALPGERNFLVACGLAGALDYLEGLRFTGRDLDYLRTLGLFTEAFLKRLASLRFTGDVWAMSEGRVAFAGEPLLVVRAPLLEAQLVETFLLNALTFPTLVASKAARVAIACVGRPFVDFSARRDHGPDAALLAARAAFVGGAAATATVEAGARWGIPVSGTMAHSYVMAVGDEEAAFRAFARQFGDRSVLLIDTFDTLEGARRAARVARELAAEGIHLRAVRLDSGDLAALALAVRQILDDGGAEDVEIFASGDLDETRIAALLAGGAPIDGFGVGTRLGTGGDAPTLSTVYKLVEDAQGPKMKLSTGKATLPGRKQVFREIRDGVPLRDVIALADEELAGEPLLELVMRAGWRLAPPEPLTAAQARCREDVARLPQPLRDLAVQQPYEVALSPRLRELVARLTAAQKR